MESGGKPLGEFDVIVYGISLPECGAPPAVRASLAPRGVLLAPQCKDAARVEKDGGRYCAGNWRLYRHAEGGLAEAWRSEMETKYIVPTAC